MVMCAVVGCTKVSGRHKARFFSIPSVITNQCMKTLELSTRRRKEWILKIRREDLGEGQVKPYTRVCNLHFVSGAPAKLFDFMNPDWSPSMNMGYKTLAPNQLQAVSQTYKRMANRRFPRDRALFSIWAIFCGMKEETVLPSHKLCAKHFLDGDFIDHRAVGGHLRLKDKVKPTIFISNYRKRRRTAVSTPISMLTENSANSTNRFDEKLPLTNTLIKEEVSECLQYSEDIKPAVVLQEHSYSSHRANETLHSSIELPNDQCTSIKEERLTSIKEERFVYVQPANPVFIDCTTSRPVSDQNLTCPEDTAFVDCGTLTPSQDRASLGSAPDENLDQCKPIIENEHPEVTEYVSCGTSTARQDEDCSSDTDTADSPTSHRNLDGCRKGSACKTKFLRYVGDITCDDVKNPGLAERNLTIIKRTIAGQRKKINALQQKNRRLVKKLQTLKPLIAQLKKKGLVSDGFEEGLWDYRPVATDSERP